MSLRDEFKDKTLKNAKEVERQKRQAFEKQFDEFIDEVLVKDFAEWVFNLVKKDVRLRINNGHISESFFGHRKIVRNELAVGPDSQFGQTHYREYAHAFPNSLTERFDKHSINYWTGSGYRYKGLTFSTFKNTLTVRYIEGLFLGKVNQILAEKLKEEPGLSVWIHPMKIMGEDPSFYVTVNYKFVL